MKTAQQSWVQRCLLLLFLTNILFVMAQVAKPTATQGAIQSPQTYQLKRHAVVIKHIQGDQTVSDFWHLNKPLTIKPIHSEPVEKIEFSTSPHQKHGVARYVIDLVNMQLSSFRLDGTLVGGSPQQLTLKDVRALGIQLDKQQRFVSLFLPPGRNKSLSGVKLYYGAKAPLQYRVTVKYVDQNNQVINAQPSVSTSYPVGATYQVVVPKIAGYQYLQPAENSVPLTGIVTGDLEVVLQYTNIFSLTTHFIDENGQQLSPDEVQTLPFGTHYESAAKTISGYTFLKVLATSAPVQGDLQADTIITYVYRKIKQQSRPSYHEVTINYVDEAGNSLGTESQTHKDGEVYTINPKKLAGYQYREAKGETSGVVNGTKTITLVYAKQPAEKVPVEKVPETTVSSEPPKEATPTSVTSSNAIKAGTVTSPKRTVMAALKRVLGASSQQEKSEKATKSTASRKASQKEKRTIDSLVVSHVNLTRASSIGRTLNLPSMAERNEGLLYLVGFVMILLGSTGFWLVHRRGQM